MIQDKHSELRASVCLRFIFILLLIVPGSNGEKVMVPFSELEESINDIELSGSRDEVIEDELFLADRYV